MMMDPGKDYYQVLQVSPEADTEALREAYRAQVGRYNPKQYHMSDKTLMQARLQEVQEAYDVLSQPETRRRYEARRQQYLEQLPPSGKPRNWRRTAPRILGWALLSYLVVHFLLEPILGASGLQWVLVAMIGLLVLRLAVIPRIFRS